MKKALKLSHSKKTTLKTKSSVQQRAKKKKSPLKAIHKTSRDFTLHYHQASKIAELVLNVQNSRVNILSHAVLEQLSTWLETLEKLPVAALVLKSSKTNSFIAGADLHEIIALRQQGTAEALVTRGQAILSRLSQFKAPSIAVIHGHAYGGGLELALACTYRVVSAEKVTHLGLPEVTLGILPGFGGTQRLPILIGLPRALSMILKGSMITAKQAYRYGLADALIPEAYLPFQLPQFIKKVILDPESIEKQRRKRNHTSKLKQLGTWFFRKIIFKKVRQQILRQTGEHYPAPLSVLNVIQQTYPAHSPAALKRGLKIEGDAFIKLFSGEVAGNLLHLFTYSTAIKNNPLTKPARWTKQSASSQKGSSKRTLRAANFPISSASVIGAGAMGAGITWFLSHSGLPVRMKDISWKYLQQGHKHLQTLHRQRERKAGQKRYTTFRELSRVSYSDNWGSFHDEALVIEAVPEDMVLKKKIFKELEAHSSPQTILATNTSSLDINEIARTLKHSERFLGIHFFNPVHRMRLVEIAASSQTDPVLFTQVGEFLRRHNKIVIPVKACPGFLVNRILFAYLNEAMRILDDTKDVKAIDESLTAYGMPMGPLTLIDQVGIDVCAHVGPSLNIYAPPKERSIAGKDFLRLKKMNWLGKKSELGFYLYDKDKQVGVNPALYQKLYGDTMSMKRSFKPEEIVERLIFALAREALVCLEEKVVQTHWELDIALLYGIGFPAFRGGILRYLDSLSLDKVIKKFDRLTSFYGEHFNPPALLKETYKKQKTFYKD